MKTPRPFAILAAAACLVSARAENPSAGNLKVGTQIPHLLLQNGRTYDNVTVTKIDDEGVSIQHEAGLASIKFDQFSAEFQADAKTLKKAAEGPPQRFGPDILSFLSAVSSQYLHDGDPVKGIGDPTPVLTRSHPSRPNCRNDNKQSSFQSLPPISWQLPQNQKTPSTTMEKFAHASESIIRIAAVLLCPMPTSGATKGQTNDERAAAPPVNAMVMGNIGPHARYSFARYIVEPGAPMLVGTSAPPDTRGLPDNATRRLVFLTISPN